jgi:6-pyruvoyl-tetrahydropterin synthase
LVHGHRYAVCVHAATTEIQHEKWTEILDEVNSCSDGVTVDLTPPVFGKVWIGSDPDTLTSFNVAIYLIILTVLTT